MSDVEIVQLYVAKARVVFILPGRVRRLPDHKCGVLWFPEKSFFLDKYRDLFFLNPCDQKKNFPRLYHDKIEHLNESG